MAVYTKRGDGGKTSLYDPQNSQTKRVSKSSVLINAIGAIDEVNSFIGITITEIKKNPNLKIKLQSIQNDLFIIGSILAGADFKLDTGRVKDFEREIDEIEGTLPVLTGFILPGGDVVSSHIQFARSLVRRAERSLVALSETGTQIPTTDILTYINRLSDYFFMLARKNVFDKRGEEIKWKSVER